MKLEIERKFVTYGDFEQLKHTLSDLLRLRATGGAHTDTYYRPVKGFSSIRVRSDGEYNDLLTLKRPLDGNRVREEYEAYLCRNSVKAVDILFGSPLFAIEKRFAKWIIGGAEVSIARIDGDDRCFLEVEADSETAIKVLVARIKNKLTLREEKRSLFEIFKPKQQPRKRSKKK